MRDMYSEFNGEFKTKQELVQRYTRKSYKLNSLENENLAIRSSQQRMIKGINFKDYGLLLNYKSGFGQLISELQSLLHPPTKSDIDGRSVASTGTYSQLVLRLRDECVFAAVLILLDFINNWTNRIHKITDTASKEVRLPPLNSESTDPDLPLVTEEVSEKL